MNYVERKIRNKFRKVSKNYLAVALVGARQAGKTTFLKSHMRKGSSYVLFDDPDAREIFEEDIKKFENQYVKSYELSILDEVHYCKDAGKKIKYLIDKGHKIWLTSSSEIILSKEILSYLVGRISIFKLFPFSLSEFLRAKEYKEVTKKIINREVDEHILYGGYPRVVLNEDYEMKKIILKDLYQLMALKDIMRNFSIDDSDSFQKLVKYLSNNTGKLISYKNIAGRIDLSYKTIKRYLSAMEKGYLVTRIKPFFTNKLKEIIKQPKIYFLDLGIRNVIANNFKIEGNIFENYVLTEIVKAGHTPKYWRSKSKAEVDFVINESLPVEIKLKSPDKTPKSLKSFIKIYGPKEAFIVFKNGEEKIEKINNCEVKFISIYNFIKVLETNRIKNSI